MSTEQQECSLCQELNGKFPNRLSTYLGTQRANLIFASTADVVVVPSVGGLTDRHYMMVPRQHTPSVLTDRALCGQVDHHLGRFSAKWRENRPLLVFEHGSFVPLNEDARCGTSHGHLHFIPVSPSIGEAVLDSLPKGKPHPDPWSAVKSVCPREFVVAGLWQGGFVGASITTSGLRSQYLRRILADLLGLREWDWRRLVEPHPQWVAASQGLLQDAGI